MNILLISSYPNMYDKSRSIFVYRLMQSLAEGGANIVVISPESWRSKTEGYLSEPGVKQYGMEAATVYRPKYFDFPNRARLGGFTLGKYNAHTYRKAVMQTIRKIDFKPDVVYAHFLYRSGPAAISASKYYNVPAIVALGESTLDKYTKIYAKAEMKKLIHQFSGVISVSDKNKNYCIKELGFPEELIEVFPNSVNHEVFYPRDKQEMREKYGLPHNMFITGFTGHFIDRKGPLRVLEAINELDDNIGGVFIGSGNQEPQGKKVLYKGRVPHQQVAELLSACDVFVLPTKDEGSCNAVVEAMACGLPIISSDIEAIREQVDQENGILCDPNNVQEIKEAVQILYEDSELRAKKRAAALKTAKANSLKNRTLGIFNFLSSHLK